MGDRQAKKLWWQYSALLFAPLCLCVCCVGVRIWMRAYVWVPGEALQHLHTSWRAPRIGDGMHVLVLSFGKTSLYRWRTHAAKPRLTVAAVRRLWLVVCVSRSCIQSEKNNRFTFNLSYRKWVWDSILMLRNIFPVTQRGNDTIHTFWC